MSRSLLHVNQLDAFKDFIEKDGWAITATKGAYEVLRAVKPGRKPCIVHERISNNSGTKLTHLTVWGTSQGLAIRFLRAKKTMTKEKPKVGDTFESPTGTVTILEELPNDVWKVSNDPDFSENDRYVTTSEIENLEA